jgi:glycosyltransferase involved in cell wall biosynthesis
MVYTELSGQISTAFHGHWSSRGRNSSLIGNIPDMPCDNPKVVILLATLNGAEYLSEQLQSFCEQSHSNWELLVSDDGSTDQTVELVQAFASQSPQRVTLLQGPKQGFWRNFLSLIRSNDVDGEFFAYSDQDDVWFPTKLKKAVAWLAKVPDETPALYFTRTALVGKNGKLLGFSPLFARTPSFQNALVQNIGGGNTMVFNRAARLVLAAAPPEIELIAHDWWTYQMVTGVGGVTRYDSWPSVKYRQHEHNLVGSNVGMRQRTLRLRAFAQGRVVTWNDTNIKALNKMRHLLTPSSVATLDQFAQARKTPLPKRLYLLWKAGAYRQSVLDNIGIVVGSLLGRV